MAKPFLRYLPAKLKPLSAPAVWIPLTVFTLLSILLWEYYHNPDWFERDPITNANPESALTPDEQAKLSEIDTVDLLLQGAQVSGPLSDVDSLEDNKDLLDAEALENAADIDTAGGADNRRLANRSDPFGSYAAEYDFPGGNRSNLDSPRGTNSLPLRQSSSANAIDRSLKDTALSAPSAFSNAIDRQQAIKDNEASRNGESSSLEQSSSSLEGFSQTSPQSSQELSTPFIRTTPAMSPPVGTTGYQIPASSNLPGFNRPPTPTTPNLLNAPIAPSGSNAIAPGQIGNVQPQPLARPVQPSQVPPSGTIYTAPRSIQPEQNRRGQ